MEENESLTLDKSDQFWMQAFSLFDEVQELRKVSKDSLIPLICYKLSIVFDAEYVIYGKLKVDASEIIDLVIYDSNHKKYENGTNIITQLAFNKMKKSKHDILFSDVNEVIADTSILKTVNPVSVVTGIYDSDENISGMLMLVRSTDIKKTINSLTLLSFCAFHLGEVLERNNLEKNLNTTLNAFKDQEEALQAQEKELIDFVSEITEQRHEVAEKNKALEEALKLLNIHKQRITNSIRYAKNIQQSILPVKDDFLSFFSDSFLIYKPKDIVSGDFYWSYKEDDRHFYFAVIDCTGHGVPGALMSMIAHSLLDEAVYRHQAKEPADILDYIRKELSERYQTIDQRLTDGMDICLCKLTINNQRRELRVSNAKRPLLFVQDGTLQKIKGSNIKIQQNNNSSNKLKPFEQNSISLKADDILYLFTDGYVDQNNPERKRLGSTKFQEIIEKNARLNLNEQKQILEKELIAFQQTSEQRDDITILALKV